MKIFIIDGNGFCYRAYYAIRDLRNKRGEPTNVVYGFCMMLKSLLEQFKPDGILVTFDVKGPTFRHQKYEAYKSHRKPMPEDLIVQMPVVKRLLKAFAVPILEKQGYEADDLIGTVAKALRKGRHEAVIVSGDKDLFQLVRPGVTVMNPQKNFKVFDEEGVKQEFGVEPGQVVDVLALMGDASDYIPGVPGVGSKTAIQLISEFGSLANIYKQIEKVKPPSKQKAIRENQDSAYLSQELATIDQDVPIKIDIKDFERQAVDQAQLEAMYVDLDFRSLLKTEATQTPQPKIKTKYELVCSQKEWDETLLKLKKVKCFAFDFETTSTDALAAEPIGLSFSCKAGQAVFVLFKTHESKQSSLDAKQVLKSLKPFFESDKVQKVGQNIKYEMTILRRYGIWMKGIYFDTMLASYCLDPSRAVHNLNAMAWEHLDLRLTSIESLIGKGKQQISMAAVPVEPLKDYGCQDSDITFRLMQVLLEKLKQKNLLNLFKDIEMPMIEVICDMEMAGIQVDLNYLKRLSKEMGQSLEGLKKHIYKLAKHEFNINSPKQLAEVLFMELGLPVMRKTKTGPSTDVDVLNQLSQQHDLPKIILEYREINKLKSTYVDTMPELTNAMTGRVHSSFNQAVTATGRLSSNHPNLQNIPIRKEEGRKIRKAFIADKNHVFLSADYSQIELRILAHFSQDENLIKAFAEGQDVHRYTASLIFSGDSSKVTPKMREVAKTVNFGVIYGISAFGLSRSLKISQQAAADFIRSYFERYPGVRTFIDQTIEKARQQGYVETLFQRRRYIPDIASKDQRARGFAERTAVNAPLQGTASDLIKIAMIRIRTALEKFDDTAKLLIQVHDELVFEVEQARYAELKRVVKHHMEGAVKLRVPIEVTLKSGLNWRDMERAEREAKTA